MKVGLGGGTLAYADQELTLYRHGRPEQVWMNLDYSPVLDEAGRPAGVIAIVVETTQRVMAERRVRESEARFRALVNATSDVVYRMSPDLTEMQQLGGRGVTAGADVPGIAWMDEYLLPEDRPAISDAVQRAIATRGVFQLEHRVKRLDGSIGWISSRAIPLTDDQGRIVEWFGAASDITERRNSEEILRANRDELRRVNEILSESERTLRDRESDLARVQKIARVAGVNVDLRNGFDSGRRSPEYLDIHGLRPGAVDTHDDWVRRLHPEDRDQAVQHFLATVNGADLHYSSEYRIVRPNDGQVRWIACEAQIERDEQGRPLRLIGAHMDITDRTLARQLLRESEARFRLIANSAPVPMWVSKLDGTRSFANQAYLDFLGLEYQQALVFDWREILHPDDQSRIVKESVAGEASLRPFVLEARYRRSDGAWRWMRSESQPRWDPAGNHIGFIGVAHDVTAAKQAEADLRRLNETLEQRIGERTAQLETNEAQLRSIFETSNQYQALLDLAGNIIYANRTALEGIKAAAAEIVGKPFRDSPWFAATAGAREAVGAGFAEVAGGASVRTEMRLQLPIGERYFDFAMRAVVDRRGAVAGVLAEAIDVTERRQAEEALRQSQKMEAVGQLTGGVAHDFNNLLTIVRSATDFLRRRDLSEERRRRYIDAISDTVDRASKLTGQLLAFARRQPLAPQVFDVGLQVEVHCPADPAAGRQPNPDRARNPRPRMFCGGRRRAIRNFADQPRRQRPRRHERRGPDFDQCRQDASDPVVGHQCGAQRPIHRDFRPRYGQRHSARQADGDFRAVLHHQGGRQRHRPRPQPDARIRQTVRRRDCRRKPAGRRARPSPSTCPRPKPPQPTAQMPRRAIARRPPAGAAIASSSSRTTRTSGGFPPSCFRTWATPPGGSTMPGRRWR